METSQHRASVVMKLAHAHDSMSILACSRWGLAYLLMSPLAFGVFATVLAVATILFQAHPTARVERRFGPRGCALLGLALQIAAFGAIGLAWNGILFGWLICSSCRAASLFSVESIVAPVAFTQLFAWTIAASRPAILAARALFRQYSRFGKFPAERAWRGRRSLEGRGLGDPIATPGPRAMPLSRPPASG
jgi:hypothetical protein